MKTGRTRILGQDMTPQLAVCQVCTDHKKDNSPGTNRLKKAVLGDHEKSKKHKEATVANTIKNTLPQCMLRQVAQDDESLGNIFRWLAVRDIAQFKLDSLCELLKRCGALVLGNYHNNHSSAEIVGCLAEVMRKSMTNKITSDESSLFIVF